MWSKILTIVNTILIFILFGAGLFSYQENSVNQQRFENELANSNSELENLISFQKEIMENPILNLGLEQGDTLRMSENGLIGFVDVEAFLTYKEKLVATLEDPLQVAVLGVKNATDIAFNEYVSAQVELEAEYFSSEEGVFYIPLGCAVNGSIESSNLILDEEVLSDLETDTENPVKVRLFFNSGAVFVDACESGVSGLQILN
jgi:hypothetical protein